MLTVALCFLPFNLLTDVQHRLLPFISDIWNNDSSDAIFLGWMTNKEACTKLG